MPARKQPTLREIVQKRDRPRDKVMDGANVNIHPVPVKRAVEYGCTQLVDTGF